MVATTAGVGADVSDADSGWRARLRNRAGLDRCYRCGVFVAGLVVVLAGCALWLLSVLAAVPAVLAGVWLWSREFEWGRRLLAGVKRYGARLWKRARRRPLRWSIMTAAGLALGAASFRFVG